MATTQNGMRSPWQQTWRGELSGDGDGGARAGLWSFGRQRGLTFEDELQENKVQAFKN